MSLSSQLITDSIDHPNSQDKYNPPLAIRRAKEKAEQSNVTSLMALSGRLTIQEAQSFFDELQTNLSTMHIQGDNANQLWCLFDWHRYILSIWSSQFTKSSHQSQTKWMAMKESWEQILEAAATLLFKYADLSNNHSQRMDSDEFNFSRFLRYDFDKIMTNNERAFAWSFIAATETTSLITSFKHESAFAGLTDSLLDRLSETQTQAKLEQQRKFGIDPAEFREFIDLLDREIKQLIAVSTTENRDAIHLSLHRAFKVALSHFPSEQTFNAIRFYHALLSKWPPGSPTLQLETDTVLQDKVQSVFACVIGPQRWDMFQGDMRWTTTHLHDILALGADIRGKVNGGNDCALWASAGSDTCLAVFEALVHAGAPYTRHPTSYSTPLHAAAKAGNLEIVRFLFTRFQIDVNEGDGDRNTALHHAGKNGHETVIKFLLQQPGIDVNARDSWGSTPFLHAVGAEDVACKKKKYAVIKTLMRSKSVNINSTTSDSLNALHLAAALWDATLKIILRHVQGINTRDELGETPLHKAVKANSGPNVDDLLKHGADPSVINEQGFTPLLLACSKRHLGPMKRLLRLKDSLTHHCPSPVKNPGTSSMHWSPVTLVLEEVDLAAGKRLAHFRLALDVILAAEPDLEVRDDKGRSVLNRLAKRVNEEMLRTLIQAGADVNSRDNRNKSVLNRAIKSIRVAPLHLLLTSGADANVQDDDGKTPLHRLMGSWPLPENLRLLLEYGADPDIVDHNGQGAVPADCQDGCEHDHRGMISIIRLHKAEKAKEQELRRLQVLAQRERALADRQKRMKKKKKEIERIYSRPSRNLFAALAIEETETTEEDE